MDPILTQLNKDDHTAAQNSPLKMILPLLIVSGIGGILTSIFYFLYQLIRQYIHELFFSSITIDNENPLFDHVQKFLMAKGYLNIKKITNLQATEVEKDDWREECGAINRKDQQDVEFKLNSGGVHMFNYKGSKIIFTHIVGKTLDQVGSQKRPKKMESISLTCYGARGNKIDLLKELLQQAAEYVENKDDDQLRIYAKHEWMTAFKEVQKVKNRKLDTVILDQNIAHDIIDDIKRFQESKTWYENRGVPYRRGYLLWGPPGTGKTSFIKAVASACQLSVCYLNLSSGQVDDDRLMMMLEKAPQKTIITLEDVDALFKERESQQQQERNISFSGLLNALDGIRSQEGRIVFMTTNHIEKLDPALLRPGRADMKIQLNNASSNQVKRFFLRFYPGQEQLAEEFTRQIPEYKLSMAKLQGHFLLQQHRFDPELAVKNAKLLLDEDLFMKDMSVAEWLHRLGIVNYLHGIKDNNLNSLTDLKHISRIFAQAEIKEEVHQKRITGMLSGDEEIKNGFKLLSLYALRQLIETYIQDKKTLEAILNKLSDNKYTEWQIREALLPTIMVLRRVPVMDRINMMIKIQDCIDMDKSEQAAQLVNDEIKRQKDQLKQQKLDKIIVQDLLQKEEYDKFVEKIGSETQFFLNLTEAQIENDIEIKDYKKRKNLFKLITKLKAVVEDEDKDDSDLFDEDDKINIHKHVYNDEVKYIRQLAPLTRQKTVQY